MDDIILYSDTIDEHQKTLETVLERLHESGISLKASKCIIAASKVDFLGYELSSKGIKPQQRLTDAIDNFSTPTNKKELKQFLGLSGFYRQFIPDYANIAHPLNKLTSDNVPFTWTSSCNEAFNTLKAKLRSEPVLAFPRIGEPFVVEVDSSDYAAGGVLSQNGKDNRIHPVSYMSIALNNSQQNWAPYTKEAYALLLALRKWHVYLAGTNFTIYSDHNPLSHLRQKKDPRGKLARWLAEMEEYDYNVKYIPGKNNVKADPFSRNKHAITDDTLSEFENKIYAFSDSNAFAQQLIQDQNSDPTIAAAKHCIEQNLSITAGRFKRIQGQLRIEKGILTKAGRPIVPPSLRKHVTTELHKSSHCGTDKLYSLLKKRFFWPNMYRYVKHFIANCEPCGRCKVDNNPGKAPLLPMVIPEAPMQFVSIDIATLPTDTEGFRYILLMGDIFSKYIEATAMRDQTASTIVSCMLKSWIMRHGNPFYLLSDQGSNVDGNTMHAICNTFGIEKRRSSAYHSQGNGFAERNIRNIREILRTILFDRNKPLSAWRELLPEVVFSLNTTESKAINTTPYEVVFGRPATLPQDMYFGIPEKLNLRDATTAEEYAADTSFTLSHIYTKVKQFLQLSKERMQNQYNKNTRIKDYKPGDSVWLKIKHYKVGEHRKLSPRKSGPWKVVERLPNGVTFKIRNTPGKYQIVHHDRLSPCSLTDIQPKPKQKDGGNQEHAPLYTEYSSESDSDDSDLDQEPAVPHRRYPARAMHQRVIPGGIPTVIIDN